MQSSIAFPQSLTEKYRPRNIADFIGITEAKKVCSKLVANPFPSAWLFLGASGTGKTTLALALANELPAELHHIPSQQCNVENLERVRITCQYVPRQGCKMHLVLVDEMDQMTLPAQLKMLSYTDSTDFPPNTIFIGTANSTERLEDGEGQGRGRFLSRFHVIPFSSYGIAKETAELLASVWRAEAKDSPAPNFARIVKESNNNVRAALTALETELMML